MYRFKNPKVEIDRTLYEIVWITEFAEHISSNFYDRDDTARHLNFGQIQDLILNNDRYEFWKPNMIKFFKKLPDGKDYVVIALIKVKRVVPKSGRIDNFKNNRIGVRI